jgi:hypothetical protein
MKANFLERPKASPSGAPKPFGLSLQISVWWMGEQVSLEEYQILKPLADQWDQAPKRSARRREIVREGIRALKGFRPGWWIYERVKQWYKNEAKGVKNRKKGARQRLLEADLRRQTQAVVAEVDPQPNLIENQITIPEAERVTPINQYLADEESLSNCWDLSSEVSRWTSDYSWDFRDPFGYLPEDQWMMDDF